MPANVLRALKESLQLDVRYLTKPEEGEGGPLPPAPVVEVVDQSELIEKLRRQIAELEKEILDQKYTIQDRESFYPDDSRCPPNLFLGTFISKNHQTCRQAARTASGVFSSHLPCF